MGEKFRIVERIGDFGGSSWPWRWRVERLEPQRDRRFLWWCWTVSARWVPVTSHWNDYATCKAIIANRGELTKVVEQ